MHPSLAPSPPASLGLVAGLLYPLRGLRLCLSVPSLRRWSLATMAVTALSLLALVALLVAWVPDLLQTLWARPEGGWVVAWYALAAVLFSVGLVLGAVTVPALATAPFVDPLVAATEAHIGRARREEGGLGAVAAETVAGILKTLLRIGLLLLGQALLLPLWLLPGAGHAVWSVLSLAWTVYWLVFEYLDLAANRRGYRFREVAQAIAANPVASAGFGAAVHLMLWLPLVNTLFIPAATVGATLYFHDLRDAGRLPPSRREIEAKGPGAAAAG